MWDSQKFGLIGIVFSSKLWSHIPWGSEVRMASLHLSDISSLSLHDADSVAGPLNWNRSGCVGEWQQKWETVWQKWECKGNGWQREVKISNEFCSWFDVKNKRKGRLKNYGFLSLDNWELWPPYPGKQG